MVVVEDLNARAGDEMIEGIVGQNGVPGRNESGVSNLKPLSPRSVSLPALLQTGLYR